MKRVVLTTLFMVAFAAGGYLRPYFTNAVRSLQGTAFVGNKKHSLRRHEQFSEITNRSAVVMLGDSRIEHADWNEFLNTPWIFNRGISGDTTLTSLRRIDGAKLARVCVIQVGVNDIMQGVPPIAAASNIALMVSRLKACGVKPVVTSIVFASGRRAHLNEGVRALNIAASNSIVHAGGQWLDLNTILAPHETLQPQWTPDGLHLNTAGYRAIAPKILAALE